MFPRKSRRYRLILAGTAVAVVAPLAAAIPAAADSGPPPTATPTSEPRGDDRLAIKGIGDGRHTVTLITGDQVIVDGEAGRFAISTEATPRPGGEQVSFTHQAGPDGAYVFPNDTLAAVQAGSLDRELFNVQRLIADGHADDATLPVIVKYREGLTATTLHDRAEALPAAAASRGLRSINGAGARVRAKDAEKFWAAIAGNSPALSTSVLKDRKAVRLGAGLAKVWLDGKVKATLSESVPLIGAPEAWAAGRDGTGVKVGVLDTGIDATHPDLEGRIAGTQSFVPDQEVKDGHGHGTHVASTIAGTGAASAGARKGVAPGAELLVGKVLNNAGSGDTSWIIAGMEWAAAGGAKVISMSLGGSPTDGTDPMALAVDRITAESGTLFVIAAGNDGPSGETVGTPGSAGSALTVAATDKSDGLASFSSRGPRTDGALKPDIAAPGVNIGAARAAGTGMGTPIDDRYTRANGTSMATPHVAGAAAVLAQQHQDWDATRLKTALMSTAKDAGHTVYQQGAGRVDVARADRQQVTATTANVDFGIHDQPDQVRKEITYTNGGEAPVTLTLTPSLRTADGQAVPAGTLTTDATVTVPAGGTVTTGVTLDPADLANGTYTGAITATAPDDVRLTTPVGLLREPPKSNLTIRTLGPRGEPADVSFSSVIAVDVPGAGDADFPVYLGPGTLQYRVKPGTYSVAQNFERLADDGRWDEYFLVDPEFTVTEEDAELTLDARESRPMKITTPKPSEKYVGSWTYQRTIWDGSSLTSGHTGPGTYPEKGRLHLTPTQRVTKGTFRYAGKWTLGRPLVRMSVQRPERMDLHPQSRNTSPAEGSAVGNYVPFDGKLTAPIADVLRGSPEDVAAAGVRGKIALLQLSPDIADAPYWGCSVSRHTVRRLKEAGAVGVLVYAKEDWGGCAAPHSADYESEPPMALPWASLPRPEGYRLREMAGAQRVTVAIDGTPDSPYTYELRPAMHQRIPQDPSVTYTESNLATVETDYHAPEPTGVHTNWGAWDPGQNVDFSTPLHFQAPRSRTVHYGPLSPETLYRGTLAACGAPHCAPPGDTSIRVTKNRVFAKAGISSEQWSNLKFAPVPVDTTELPRWPVPRYDDFCAMCREGDTLFPTIGGSFGQSKLVKDGEEVPQNPNLGVPAYTLPEEKGTYRLTSTSGHVESEWTFDSQATPVRTARPGYACLGTLIGAWERPCSPQPFIFLGYDLGSSLRMNDTVAAPGTGTIKVTAGNPQSVEPMPEVTGLKLSMSTDGGQTWEALPVTAQGDGVFSASVRYPDPGEDGRTVTLRAEATDAAGNSVRQTITDAFKLTRR